MSGSESVGVPNSFRIIDHELDWHYDEYNCPQAWTDMQECDHGCGYGDQFGDGFGNGNSSGNDGYGYDVAIRLQELIWLHGGNGGYAFLA